MISKERIWVIIFFIGAIITLLFSIDSFHFAKFKKRTDAVIKTVEKKSRDDYKIVLAYYDGRDSVKRNNRINNSQYKKIKGEKLVTIFYRDSFFTKTELVYGSSNFLGNGFILLITSCLFFLGFYVTRKNIKSK